MSEQIANINQYTKRTFLTPSSFGFAGTSNAGLIEIITAMPEYSQALFWINNSSDYPGVYNDVKNYTDMSQPFGLILLQKQSSVTVITWISYSSPGRFHAVYSTINNVGMSAWRQIGYGISVGTIIAVMGTTTPQYYLYCNGATYNITSYPTLADYIKAQFGSYNFFGGDGTTTFAVPDLRGEFLRGNGTNGHADQGNGSSVGVHQNATKIPYLYFDKNGNNFVLGSTEAGASDTATTAVNADKEFLGESSLQYVARSGSNSNNGYAHFSVRPTNTSVRYCIAYRNM